MVRVLVYYIMLQFVVFHEILYIFDRWLYIVVKVREIMVDTGTCFA